MELHGRETPPREDWHAVMADLLSGASERQHLAALKLNRLLSGFLYRLDLGNYGNEFEDLRQTVLFKLAQRFRTPPLPAPEAFVTYAWRTTRNEFFALLRTRPAEALRDPEAEPEPLPPPSALDPVTRLALQTCLERLPQPLRDVIEARYFGDLKLEQAARATGQALATVKRHLRAAFDHLRECLAGHLPTPEV